MKIYPTSLCMDNNTRLNYVGTKKNTNQEMKQIHTPFIKKTNLELDMIHYSGQSYIQIRNTIICHI